MPDKPLHDHEQSENDASRQLRNRMIERNQEYSCRVEAQQSYPLKPLERISEDERRSIGLPEVCDEVVPPIIKSCTGKNKGRCAEA